VAWPACRSPESGLGSGSGFEVRGPVRVQVRDPFRVMVEIGFGFEFGLGLGCAPPAWRAADCRALSWQGQGEGEGKREDVRVLGC